MDRLTSMRIFTRVVELGSYSAVASEQGISAQMVGKHVLGLEQWLGGKLFHKTTRQQTLTELGQLFLSRCERVLEELALTESLTQNLLAEPAGRLRIAAPSALVTTGCCRCCPPSLSVTPSWIWLCNSPLGRSGGGGIRRRHPHPAPAG
ncbi:LysR family transcriptional regulator [Aeromonas salmonicida]